nr:transglutaminase N-terminal domain-containing protein [Cryobacterium sp. M23]
MDRLRNRHVTGYRYPGEVGASDNEARMLPVSSADQFVSCAACARAPAARTSSSRWRSPGRPEPRRGIRCLGPTDAAAHPPRPSNQFDGDFEDGALSQRGLNRFEQNLRRIRSGRRAPRARRALSSPTSRSRGPARRASSG